MKALALTALAAAVLTCPVTTRAASAAPDPTGILCGFVVQDLEVEERFTGTVVGGPLAFPDDTETRGTLVCTIQTGTNDTHAETDVAVVTGTGSRVSAVAGTVTYDAPGYADQWICSHVDRPDGPDLYWDAGARAWSADPSAGCSLAISVSVPDLGPVSGEWDPIFCPIYALAFPPEGDVTLPVVGVVEDCPPYGDDEHVSAAVAHTTTHLHLPEATEPR